jgi:integrase
MQDNTNNNPFNINQAFLQIMAKEQESRQSSKMRGEVGSLFRDDSITSFFDLLRKEVIDSWEPDPAPDSIVISEAERTAKMAQELKVVEVQEDRFQTWLREECPLAKLETFLAVTKRKDGTKKFFRHAAQRYYRFNQFAPEFSDKELFKYLIELDVAGLTPRSIKQHRMALKRWWRVLGYQWPLDGVTVSDEIQEETPPTFSAEQVSRLVSLVKEKGTPEQKYYFALSTVFGCRAGELGNITAKNFQWNDDDTGILTVPTLKRGKKRVHHIPEGLTPFLKEYSYMAKPSCNTIMGEKFHRFCKHIGFPIPKMPLKNHVDMNGKKIHVKGYGWHAIRHSLVTELVETHVSEIYISQWMGWKSQQSMVRRYAILDALKVDKEVQEKHPFLPLWTSW